MEAGNQGLEYANSVLSKQSIRKLKSVRKLFRAQRSDPKMKIMFRAVDDMVKEKQAALYVERQTLMKRMFDLAMAKRKAKKK